MKEQTKKTQTKTPDTRKARLKSALRENLKRRKAAPSQKKTAPPRDGA